jgi:hypothetical protein
MLRSTVTMSARGARLLMRRPLATLSKSQQVRWCGAEQRTGLTLCRTASRPVTRCASALIFELQSEVSSVW